MSLAVTCKFNPFNNDDCMFKIDKLKPGLCNDCDHISKNDGVCI